MDSKIYILFQFENERANYSDIFAVKFVFAKGKFHIKKEINNYFKIVSEEKRADIFQILKGNENFEHELTYSECKDLVSKVGETIMDWEIISKEEYKLWKQCGKVEPKIIFA